MYQRNGAAEERERGWRGNNGCNLELVEECTDSKGSSERTQRKASHPLLSLDEGTNVLVHGTATPITVVLRKPGQVIHDLFGDDLTLIWPPQIQSERIDPKYR